jgi:hypothetical protein
MFATADCNGERVQKKRRSRLRLRPEFHPPGFPPIINVPNLATWIAAHGSLLTGIRQEPFEFQHKIGVRIERHPITLYGSRV